MTRLLTRNIATMTELRDPQKVPDAAKGEPVAILKNSKLVAYLVPAESVAEEPGHRLAARRGGGLKGRRADCASARRSPIWPAGRTGRSIG